MCTIHRTPIRAFVSELVYLDGNAFFLIRKNPYLHTTPVLPDWKTESDESTEKWIRSYHGVNTRYNSRSPSRVLSIEKMI